MNVPSRNLKLLSLCLLKQSAGQGASLAPEVVKSTKKTARPCPANNSSGGKAYG
jgi:hypothetical protein